MKNNKNQRDKIEDLACYLTCVIKPVADTEETAQDILDRLSKRTVESEFEKLKAELTEN